MGEFLLFLRQRRGLLCCFLAFCGLFGLSFGLYHLPLAAVLYPALLCALLGAVALLLDFGRFRRKHRYLLKLRQLDAALPEPLPESTGPLEEDYQALIQALRQRIQDSEAAYAAKGQDLEETYSLWVHQIKTPISSMGLLLEREDSPLSRQLGSQLRQIEQYVEMVLAFLRLEAPSSDYVFRETALDPLVRQVVAKLGPEFIGRRLSISLGNLDTSVITDEKWFAFVLEQLLSNALKYTRQGGISIGLEAPKTLCIRDTGCGIAPSDLPRVFEKGYTGLNGRRDKRASGIGLYLCRRICQKLGIAISISSQLDQGTCVSLDLRQARLQLD